jgi:predicted unusual protein kinase regulating ubiquinone biosynthesis (AarF/ABC1/UbiB family)
VAPEEIELLLSKQGGPEFNKNFSVIQEKPLAVASVGQVYRAKLPDSAEVVIKIIKAKFKERFTADVSKLRRFFKLVLRISPKLKGVCNPLGILDDIE